MSEFQIELIKALNKANETDWSALLGNIIGSLIISLVSAWIAYRVAKIQAETQIKKQSELEILKEKRILATNIKLQKYESLSNSINEYIRLVGKSYINVLYFSRPDKYTKQVSLEDLRKTEADLQLEIGQWSRQNEIMSAYVPDIRKKWKELSSLYFNIVNIIYDGFTYEGRFQPVVADASFAALQDSHNKFILKGIEIQDCLTGMIINTIKELEAN